MTKDDTPHFVTSQGFTCDNDYIAWLKEIKERYQRVRSRIALQANYGALEFNWMLGRDIVQKTSISQSHSRRLSFQYRSLWSRIP